MWRSILAKEYPLSLLVLSGLLISSNSWACSVCFDAQPDARVAYYGTTMILTLLPLMLLSGFIWWVYRTLSYKDTRNSLRPPK